ncbi:unnamed protein product [Vitrella brassicaformis CCMP3155]|uniref:TLDc domain-containing protein n=1 Tax=Vitrella brassicaformis (strain CCMP3155) TaxID=1169540 RepID=A0A0G4EV06_VITBC|nr:unnamed protein product [Vitrella brassicaformis CCMP3155]|eukprot:CEM02285.1 unnamed protein product [Vitrella brassicaformis CCMP3155]
MAFPRDVLLCEGLRDTCLAVLLNRFDSWMITDDNRIHFIDADPFYFIWLAVKLRYLSCSRIDVSEIIEGCPALAFYHDRFFAKTAVTIEPQHGDHDSEAFRGFMAVMGPFISSSVAGGTGGSEVLSVPVADGGVVATTDATLADYSILHDRFIKYGPVADVSADTFHKVVDYVRRIWLAPDAATPLPTSSWPDELLYACDMYGLMEPVYLSMIGKSHSHIKCLFKSSSDGGEFGTLVERVAGVSGLLFVIEDEKQHTIACHIDGPLSPPADPTSALLTGCPMTFYSINGPFEEGGIAKITVPPGDQRVMVAGTEGAVIGTKGGAGKVSIGGGRLWLGYGKGSPGGDLRSCSHWVERDELPDDKTYVGTFDEEGRATLAASHYFTAQRLEVYQVCSTLPADHFLPAYDLQALIDTTRHIGMTAQLLYKGERDGWAHTTMAAKVGEAADLLMLFKDTGSHTFASHIEGQLKQPADPTRVETTLCPVTLYSISGAFEEGGITKSTVPQNKQGVIVAGTEGAVKDSKGWAGKVAIGGGRLWLWLGIGEDGRPAGDLRRCHQLVERDELPDDKTYVGSIKEDRWATLAASLFFTCVDLEIYTLQVPDGWQWLSAVADIVLSQST